MRAMRRIQGSVPSRVLGREMEYAWYGQSGRPLVMFPTSGGRYDENEGFGLVDVLEGLVDRGAVQVCCIDSINPESWADATLPADQKLARHTLYDRYLSEEGLPWVAERAGRADLALYGASLGGWQVATFAARHPEQVSKVIALSGFYDLRRLLKGWWGDPAYFYSPVDFISNMDAEWVARLSRVEWIIATGEQDSLVEETRNLCRVLGRKGIPVQGEIWPGVFGHDWPFWKEHLPRFLP